MGTIAYVDGFNLYYRTLKHTPYKWLDLRSLACRMSPSGTVDQVRYFTATVQDRKGVKGQATRQQLYLRALRTLPNLTIHYGSFLAHQVDMYLADGSGYARVIKTEEKGTDVNIATFMLADAFRGACTHAIVISNDSDLREPVRVLNRELGIPVRIAYPSRRKKDRVSRYLAQHASDVRAIRVADARKCQFPDSIADGTGAFHKPPEWSPKGATI